MKNEVEKFLREQNLLSGSGIVVGLSGGADSVCLLLLLSEISATHGFPLYAVHVHHGIRGESAERDAFFSEQLCEKLGVPFRLFRIDVPTEAGEKGIGEEEAGRQARYRLFLQVAKEVGAQAIAVAHHRDDNAETVLFRLCRGTGIRGLCGIPRTAQVSDKSECRLIRPLLPFSREDIREELRKREQTFCTDETNSQSEYTRNYLRNEVMPMLNRVNQGTAEHLAALAEQAGQVMGFLEAETQKAYQSAVSFETVRSDVLTPYPEIVRKEVLLRFAKNLAGAEKDFTNEHASMMDRLLQSPVSKRLNLPYGVVLERTYDGLRRVADSATDTENGKVLGEEISPFLDGILLQEGTYSLQNGQNLYVSIREHVPGEDIVKNKWIKWLDCDMINSAPVLRTRREGDFFVIGKNGGTQSLQDFFVNAKVPKAERDRIPVIASDSEILFIPGFRGTERYYVTNETKRILCLEVR